MGGHLLVDALLLNLLFDSFDKETTAWSFGVVGEIGASSLSADQREGWTSFRFTH